MQMDKSGDSHKKGFHIKDWPDEDHPGEMLLEKGTEALEILFGCPVAID